MADPNEKKGKFVAVGHSMQRLTSVDGENWSKPQLGKPGEILRAVRYANNRYVAIGFCGGSNFFGSSLDGENWILHSAGNQYSLFIRDLAFGNGKFLAVGGNPLFIQTTEDGITWSDRTVFNDGLLIKPKSQFRTGQLCKITFGNGMFVALGEFAYRGISKDGKDWKPAEDIKLADAFIDVVYGNGVYVGVGLHGLRMTSVDGLKWTDRATGEEGEHINTILWTGDRFVGVGAGATYISPDGRKWERTPNQNAPLRATFGNGVFVGSHWKGRLLRSTDAITWKQVAKCENHIESIVYGG